MLLLSSALLAGILKQHGLNGLGRTPDRLLLVCRCLENVLFFFFFSINCHWFSHPNTKKNVLADMEYSDLEDISPGRLSSENERPATPDTPETATPAVDFTHPSLGFWAAPLGTNEMAKPALPVAGAPTVTEDLQASAADVLPPVTHYLDDQAHAVIEQSHAHYSVEEGSLLRVGVQEPFVAQATWPGLMIILISFFMF